MAGRWSVVTTVKFIHAYKSHECLWNPKCDLYHMRDPRKAAFADLVFQMGMPGLDVDAVKAKIRLMRAKYHNELKKVRAAAAVGEKYVPSSYWFDIMDSFLKDVVGDMPHSQPDIITADSIIDSSSIYENDFGDDEDSMEKAPPVLSMKNTSKMTSLPSTSVTSTRHPYRPGPACSKRRRRPNPISVREEYVEDEFEAFGKSVSAQLRKLSLSRALRVQTEIQKILTEEKINDIGIITNMQAVPSPTPPELVAPTFKPVASMYEPVISAKLPEVSSSDTKGANVDSGFDSGVESTSTKSISGSTARFDDIKTESIKDEPLLETEEKVSTSPPASADGKSLPLQEQMEELKAPGCVQPKDEIIHNEECEIVTLDEDDPLKGTGD